jgi:hypothetical protein
MVIAGFVAIDVQDALAFEVKAFASSPTDAPNLLACDSRGMCESSY